MKVLILCDKYLPVSEQFIAYQIQALSGRELFLFARKKVKGAGSSIAYTRQVTWYQKTLYRIRYKLTKRASKYPDFVQQLLRQFISENQIEFVYVHYGTTAVSYEPALRSLDIPVVCAFHGFDASRKLTDAHYRQSILQLSNSFVQCTVPAAYLKEKLVSTGVLSNKVKILQYGVDIPKLQSITPERLTENLTIVHAGRIVAKKGVPDLLRVFLQLCEVHPHIQLLVIGGGEEAEQVQELAEASDYKSRVHMMGPLPHDHLIRLLKGADIFVLNSRESASGETEGLPNTILEAMACEVAVVSTRHSGIPDMVSDGVTGVLVQPKSNKELYAAIDTLIRDGKLRKHLIDNAARLVADRFSLQSMVQNVQALIK